jgi:hypothetical protein
MPTPFESAQLILKLYDLRREPTLRQARHWFVREFHPDSVDDLLAVLAGEHSAYFRMVLGYWDMAASLVAHGAIDREMFLDASGESLATFAKVEHLLPELRERRGTPGFARHLEELVRSIPGHEERLPKLRAQLRARVAGAPSR